MPSFLISDITNQFWNTYHHTQLPYSTGQGSAKPPYPNLTLFSHSLTPLTPFFIPEKKKKKPSLIIENLHTWTVAYTYVNEYWMPLHLSFCMSSTVWNILLSFLSFLKGYSLLFKWQLKEVFTSAFHHRTPRAHLLTQHFTSSILGIIFFF